MMAASVWMCFPLDGAQPNDYAKSENWLCRPGRTDACSGTLTATVMAGDGSHTQVSYHASPDAPIDCFYVYPTVSREPTANSDMTPGPEEERAAKLQFASFGRVCQLYAPLYRQTTLAGLHRDFHGDDGRSSSALAYDDVLAAWRSYLARDNHGRGVVLIGHSQGARLLTRLIAEEIDGKAGQARLVSAILLGTDVEVPQGRVVGDVFKSIPLCEKRKQTGCVVAYSSYLATQPPGADAVFGGSLHAGSVDACVNPADLTDGGILDAEVPAVGRAAEIFGTTFMENPGLLHAKCMEAAGHSYLAISVGDGAESQIVSAALMHTQAALPGWGLHILDVNLALGNLVELVGDQAKAFAASAR
jgi:pimeloyl-ACP methyl ester carboxylesterase